MISNIIAPVLKMVTDVAPLCVPAFLLLLLARISLNGSSYILRYTAPFAVKIHFKNELLIFTPPPPPPQFRSAARPFATTKKTN